ncbi:MAG: hypothetical protein WDM96_04845 [Lacunisphaera sp.]
MPDPQTAGIKPPALVGDKVIVRLNDWRDRQSNPEGVLVQRLGRAFEPRAELAAIYHKYNLSTSFPDPVTREAIAIPPEVQPEDLKDRRDLPRHSDVHDRSGRRQGFRRRALDRIPRRAARSASASTSPTSAIT